MKTFLALGITVALAGGLACPAFAQTASAKQEVSTARAHALMAKNAKTLDMTHTHLHHVINCLVGSNGEGFDASAGDPCKGQGNGALPDTQDNAKLHGKLQKALSDAKAGLQADSVKAAHEDASKAAKALQAGSEQTAGSDHSW